MTIDRFTQRWPELKNDVKEQWRELTDEEIAHIDGDRERLISLIQARYGISLKDAAVDVNNWYNK